jgi:4-hydroxybutyryl-CoA dehydratase/vinylacetyl-CoA-Delta-isomerase
VDLVERLLERGILDDQTRKITRNRQPGRCCAAGCTVPDAPHMLPLPAEPSETRVVPLALAKKSGS